MSWSNRLPGTLDIPLILKAIGDAGITVDEVIARISGKKPTERSCHTCKHKYVDESNCHICGEGLSKWEGRRVS